MLYHLFQYLDKNYDFPGSGLFNFITFRAGLAVIISLVIAIFFGKRIIKYLQKMQVGESVRDLGLDGQLEKSGTPTMGGVIIILAIVVPCLLVADLTNVYILLMIFSTVWMGVIGFVDDYIKVFKKNKDGLKGKFKVIGQVVLGLIVGLVMLLSNDVVVRLTPAEAQLGHYKVVKKVTFKAADKATDYVYVKANLTNVPFLKGNNLDYSKLVSFLTDNTYLLSSILFVFICIFIITAVSNGANLTDGIDGLAAGTSAIIGVTLAVLAYVSSNFIFADYLHILYIPYTGELVIFVACFVGATMGFLWYNGYPAQVFMGDTGSLSIGGIIATLAIILRKELLLPLLCGVFLAEVLSVIFQVSYFKYTKKKTGEGKRLILMSPLHHHYQKKGIPESKIVLRFWLVGIVLAVLTIITLKVR